MFGLYEKLYYSIEVEKRDSLKAFPTTFHKCIELIYVLDGEADIRIEDKICSLKKGDVAVAFPYQKHSGNDADVRLLIVFFDPAECRAFLNLFFKKVPKNPYIRAEDIPADVHDLFLKLLTKSQCTGEFSAEILSAYLAVLVGELLSIMELEDVSGKDFASVQQILHYCMEHFNEDITLDVLSKELGFSKILISKVLANTLHSNLRECVNNLRIDEAKHLLMKTNKNILEILYECGFNNQSTFNRVFLELTGMSPKEFRRKALEEKIL